MDFLENLRKFIGGLSGVTDTSSNANGGKGLVIRKAGGLGQETEGKNVSFNERDNPAQYGTDVAGRSGQVAGAIAKNILGYTAAPLEFVSSQSQSTGRNDGLDFFRNLRSESSKDFSSDKYTNQSSKIGENIKGVRIGYNVENGDNYGEPFNGTDEAILYVDDDSAKKLEDYFEKLSHGKNVKVPEINVYGSDLSNGTYQNYESTRDWLSNIGKIYGGKNNSERMLESILGNKDYYQDKYPELVNTLRGLNSGSYNNTISNQDDYDNWLKNISVYNKARGIANQDYKGQYPWVR